VNISLSSGGMTIVAAGEVFLFNNQVDILFRLQERDWRLDLKLYFLSDVSERSQIKCEKYNGRLHMFCYNFEPAGSPCKFYPVGKIDGKTVYFMFRYFEDNRTCSIKRVAYTFYIDENKEEPQNEIV
jgi:hypothetical protein